MEIGYFDSNLYGVVFGITELFYNGEKVGDFAALIKVSTSKGGRRESYSVGITPCLYNIADSGSKTGMWIKSSVNNLESDRIFFDWEYNKSKAYGSIEYYNIYPDLDGNYYATITLADDSAVNNFTDADGNKVKFTAEVNLKDINRQTSYADYIWQPKQAELITASNFSDNENPTITYSRTANDTQYIEGIKAIISIDGIADDITRDISIDSTDYSYTFNLTAAERNMLINSVASGTTRQITFKLLSEATTWYADTYGANPIVKTFTIAEAYPTATITVEDVDTATLALTGDKRKYIKYYSNAAYDLNSTATKNASIIAESISCGNKTSTTETGILEDIESNIINFSAIDSRNNGVYGSITLDMIDYVKLTCKQKIELELSEETGAAGTLTISGNYWRGNFGAANNTLTIQTRQTDGNGNWGEWVNLSDFVEVEYEDNEYTLTVNISGLSYDKVYIFQSRAIDQLAAAITEEFSTRIMPVFDWGENDFNFNVPVKFNDKTIFTSDFEFNGDLIINDETLADYVIEVGTEEMGSNGVWNWRKWASGKAECFGCRNYGNMAVNTAWGGLYRSETFTQDLPSGLFKQTPEVIDISYRGANFGGWICRHEAAEASKNNTGAFIVVRPASATITQAPISFSIIGFWK